MDAIMSAKGGKILGIDYGTKRIGLAISDESRTFARELTILSPKEFWKQMQGIIAKNDISEIVLGWPMNMSGEENKKTKEVESFKLKIESLTGIRSEIVDERLSSIMAKNLPGGNKNIDSLAAQIFLQNYLDKSKS